MKCPCSILTLCIVFVVACSRQPEHKGKSRQAEIRNVVASATSAQPDDGQWLMAAKDYANQRFSGLDQINAGNVKNLKLAWTFSTGLVRGHEAAPLEKLTHRGRRGWRGTTSPTGVQTANEEFELVADRHQEVAKGRLGRVG